MPKLVFTVLLLLGASAAAQDQEKRKFCQSYASEGTRSAAENQRLDCGFTGARYTDDWQAHYDWCLVAPESAVLEEARIRADDLGSCRRKTADGTKDGDDSASGGDFRVFRVAATTALYPSGERGARKKVVDAVWAGAVRMAER